MTITPPQDQQRAIRAAHARSMSRAIAGGFTGTQSRRMVMAFVMGLLLALAVTAIPARRQPMQARPSGLFRLPNSSARGA
ncbi:hypothetical protein V6L77_04840 [Pannonibacter sp. Pt2-lr]